MPKSQLRLSGAVAIGLASMLGAGVFVVFREAYSISAGLIFAAIALAALTAALNAASVYRLAEQVDRPGGIYAYSRVYLNDSLSFLSGFGFVVGKIGSIAAIALVFQEYVLPDYRFWPAALSIASLAAVNIAGIQRTAAVAGVLAFGTVTFLTGVSFVALTGFDHDDFETALGVVPEMPLAAVIQGASVVFFAFAGYARVATLGNEVENPKRNIPRAIIIALLAVLVIYLLLALSLVATLGPRLGALKSPVSALTSQVVTSLPIWIPIAVAALASLGSMLALLAGVSRTASTMSQDHELPRALIIRNRFGSPWIAELFIAASAIGLVALGDLRWVIGFSSFSVLFYYAIGHISAYRQASKPGAQRAIAILGFGLCVVLALSVPGPAVPISVGVLVLALVARKILRR